MEQYTIYHCHTNRSLLDSCTDYKEYVDRVAELGYKALAFTEHGNIYNWIEKKMYINSKGLKYIHGVECYLTASLEEKIRDNYHTILLAKNYEGVKEINLLIDKSTQPDHRYYKPRITFEEFFNISDNVIKISACLASPLNKYPKDIQKQMAEKSSALKHELADKVSELEKQKNDQKAMVKWFKQFDALEEEKLPWVINGCIPGDCYLQYIQSKIDILKQYYDNKLEEVQLMNSTAKETFHKLL